MNKIPNQDNFKTPTVTTGPLPASTKNYTNPAAAPDIRVPRRLIRARMSRTCRFMIPLVPILIRA